MVAQPATNKIPITHFSSSDRSSIAAALFHSWHVWVLLLHLNLLVLLCILLSLLLLLLLKPNRHLQSFLCDGHGQVSTPHAPWAGVHQALVA
jgi:hypothetical protein